MKIIYSGLEGEGKSLKLAEMAVYLVNRNAKWFLKTNKVRPIASNLKFSQKFTDWAVNEMKIPIIYWDDLNSLTKMENCDVIIDEVGNYFDSRLWQDLSLDVRRWLTQGDKCGVEIYGSAQDFAQVDKSFRRLVKGLFDIKKIIGSRRPAATKPPVHRIWGLCMAMELDPRAYQEDKKKFASNVAIPKFFLIQRQYCEIFDTTQKIMRSKSPPLKHEVKYCEFFGQIDPETGKLHDCQFHKVVHV